MCSLISQVGVFRVALIEPPLIRHDYVKEKESNPKVGILAPASSFIGGGYLLIQMGIHVIWYDSKNKY